MVPRLAATLMLLRHGRAGALEVYLTRRHSRSRFMPDAFVFPGGAVDAADRRWAATYVRGATGSVDLPIVAAAIRETFEEAGVLLAHPPPAETVAHMRASGTPFYELLARHGLMLDGGRLAYYSHWITPRSEPIRFDAHFFVARSPEDQDASADACEVYDGMWLAPADALANAEASSMTIRFPTRKHLERLAACDDADRFIADARTRVVTAVEPSHDDATGDPELESSTW